MNNILNVVSWNARGVRYKKVELFHFLDHHNVDTCILCENWLNDTSIKNQNFYCYRSDRQQGQEAYKT